MSIEAPSGGSPKPGSSPNSGIFDGPGFFIVIQQRSVLSDYEPQNPQNKEQQNIEVKNIVLFLSKTSAVRNSLFDIRYSKCKNGGLPGNDLDSIRQSEMKDICV